MVSNHTETVEKYISGLKKNGWLITHTKKIYSDGDFPEVFKKCPKAIKIFICRMDVCANRTDDVWWLTPKIYLGIDEESAFKWNEFEIMSLESADDQSPILEYWQNVMPIIQSVKDGYSYIGVVLGGGNAGAIIMAREPFFEEFDIIAEDFESFLNLHLIAIENESESDLRNYV